MNPDFNLIGEPTNTKYGSLAYDNISISFEDISNNLGNSLKLINSDLTDEDITRLQNTISNESNKQFFNVDALRKDFKYFNNATQLMHANNANTDDYPYIQPV